MRIICGNSSVVERHLAKVNVAGSNLVSRSNIRTVFIFIKCFWGRRERRYRQVVRPRSAKPLSPVQIRVAPPKNSAPSRCRVFHNNQICSCGGIGRRKGLKIFRVVKNSHFGKKLTKIHKKLNILCHCGGIGRRNGLKIRRN